MPSGCSATDWENSALADWGRTITISRLTTRTQTSVSGDEVRTYAAPTTITAIFSLRGQSPSFARDEEGQFQDADAFLMSRVADAVLRYEKITEGGIDYYVNAVKAVTIQTPTGNVPLFHFCALMKREG